MEVPYSSIPKENGQEQSSRYRACPRVHLSDSGGALRDPVLQQPGEARDHQESDCREHPLGESTAHGKRSDRHECRAAGAYRSDDVADPVNQVAKPKTQASSWWRDNPRARLFRN